MFNSQLTDLKEMTRLAIIQLSSKRQIQVQRGDKQVQIIFLMEELRKSFEVEQKQYRLKCQLYSASLNIQIITKDQENQFYYTDITKDAFPQNLQMVFEDIEQIYDYISQPTPNKTFEIEKQNQLNLFVPILRTTKTIPIYLSPKQLTKQMKLQRKVLALQQKLKKYELQEQQQRRLKHQRFERDQKEVSFIKQKMTQLEVQNSDLKIKVRELTDQICILEMIIAESEEQVKKSHTLITEMTGQSNMMVSEHQSLVFDPEGTELPFLPLATSINARFYNFEGKIISKSINYPEANNTFKLLPCATPIPKIGRHYFKLKLNKIQQPLRIRLGFMGHNLPGLISEINKADLNAVIYSSENGSNTITQGESIVQGFNLTTADTLAIAIDCNTKQIEWHYRGDHVLTSNFTSLMRCAPNVFFFVQLWSNGDEILMLT